MATRERMRQGNHKRLVGRCTLEMLWLQLKLHEPGYQERTESVALRGRETAKPEQAPFHQLLVQTELRNFWE